MFSAATRAPSNITWPNSVVMPLIIRSGRCSMPGWRIGTAKAERPLCFGTLGVGAREQEAPVGHVGVAGPDLVAVDHVLVAVARRGGAQRREVGAGLGLAEALAPALAAADQAGQEALPGSRRWRASRCPGRGSRGSGAAARPRRRSPRRGSRRTPGAARDRRSGPARRARRSRRRRARCAIPPAGPSTRRRSTRPAGPGCSRRARRAGAPGTPPPPASHESPCGHSEACSLQLPQLLAVVAEPPRGEQRTAQVDVDDAVPRVPHPAVHLHRGLADACARRARSTPWPRVRRCGLRRGRARRRPTTGCSAALKRSFDQAAGLREEVLHGLERPDRERRTAAVRARRRP